VRRFAAAGSRWPRASAGGLSLAQKDGDGVQHLPRTLVDWIEATAGGRAVSIERRHAGGAREGWWVDVQRGDATLELFLRRDAGDGPLSGTRYTLPREGRTIQALRDTGMLVPEILGIHEQQGCTLMRRMAGEADFRRLTRDPARAQEWEEVSRQYVDQLCLLHSLDPRALDLPDHPIPANAEEHGLLEVRSWRDLYRERVSVREPVVDFGFKWLEHFVPAQVQRTVVVQGDAGPANFLFAGGRVTAVLDWDISHVGDPMEDLAGICVRGTWTPFGNLSTYLREYEKRSGLHVDFDSIRYYMHLQYMRAAVGELNALEGHDPATDVTLNTMSLVLGMRGMAQIMARSVGIERDEARVPPDAPATAFSPYFRVVAHNVESILLPEIADPYVAHRARQLASLTRVLERALALGPALEAEERDEIATLLGERSSDLASAERKLSEQIRAAAVGNEPELIEYLCRRCERRSALWAPVLGGLYYNPQPDLEAM
jgi:aminoglycoside phosphotransferase (APT) family kinase protein